MPSLFVPVLDPSPQYGSGVVECTEHSSCGSNRAIAQSQRSIQVGVSKAIGGVVSVEQAKTGALKLASAYREGGRSQSI